jgi:hypothetical protein
MAILQGIFGYLMVGIGFSFVLDLMNDYLFRHDLQEKDLFEQWGILQRIVLITFWPIGMLIFILSLIRKR